MLVGGAVVVGAGALAYKLGKKQTQQIEQHTGTPVDQMSDEEIQAAYQDPLDLGGVIRVMRNTDLEDQRNSMNAAVFAPGDLKLWYALGEVPATSAPFRELNFGAAIGKKGE